MRARKPTRGSGSQGGFSMVEMLMVAVVLGIGLLGLAMLETLALRGQGTSLNRTTAIEVGQRILEQAEDEGRNTWLNLTMNNQAAGVVPNLLYFPGGNPPAQLTQYYDVNGNLLTSAAGSVFTTVTSGVAVPNGGGTGSMADVTVTVTFNEVSAANRNTLVPHQVVLTRRVIHG